LSRFWWWLRSKSRRWLLGWCFGAGFRTGTGAGTRIGAGTCTGAGSGAGLGVGTGTGFRAVAGGDFGASAGFGTSSAVVLAMEQVQVWVSGRCWRWPRSRWLLRCVRALALGW